MTDRDLTHREIWRDRFRRWRGGGVAVLVAVALLAGARLLLAPSLDRDRLRTAPVERGPFTVTLDATGTVQAAEEHVVASPFDARVIRILTAPGAELATGGPILLLDRSEAELEVDRLSGEAAQLAAERRALELESEEAAIRRDGEVRVAALEVDQLAWEEEQQRQLHDQGLVSEAALRQAEVRRRKASIELEALRRTGERSARTLEQRIAALAARQAVVEGGLAAARRRLQGTRVVAPAAGTLTWVIAEEGVTARAGEPVARLAAPGRFRVDGTVADVHGARLTAGQAVIVEAGDELRLAGTVERVLPAVEDGAAAFRVELDEPGHPALRQNLRVSLEVVLDRVEEALSIAAGPALSGSGWQQVFVVEGDAAERRRVRLGRPGERRWQVLAGLAEGEVVVLSDTSDVKHLERVKLR